MKLIIDKDNGIAYFKDRTKTIEYGAEYYDNYKSLENTPIGRRLLRDRTNLVDKYVKFDNLLDIGCCTGWFIIHVFNNFCYGYDINPLSINWLKKRDMIRDPYNDYIGNILAFTMWDVLEHIPEPKKLLKKLPKDSYLFISIPIIKNFDSIKKWKHYKPKEHLWYFTDKGFKSFMRKESFHLIEQNDMETKAGRKDINTYVFRKINI